MKTSKYKSKSADRNGFIHWTGTEHRIWKQLFTNQIEALQGRACNEYIAGIKKLRMPAERIPQLCEIDKVLKEETGWKTAMVPALIGFEEFFTLLANKKFPVATFIRSMEDYSYLQEPDIFHEIFGHCPMLTNPYFAEFTERYGRLGLAATPKQRVFLARLYWFTVEFGLLQTEQGLRIYGGGILSSVEETKYALESDKPERNPLELLNVLRTPYRIDILQTNYFIINNLSELTEFKENDIMNAVEKAMELGLFEPTYPPKTA